MRAALSGWRLALRLARRDAVRARGRSILVLVMIALPVLAVTAADVLLQTQDVSGVESLDRRLGAADARVRVQHGITRYLQGADPDEMSSGDGGGRARALTAAEVSAALGGRPLVEEREGSVTFATDRGETEASVLATDLADPLTRGLVRLTEGRLPSAAGEVVVNAALAEKGYAVGDPLVTPGDDVADPRIVGIAESTTTRSSPFVAGPVGTFDVRTYGSRTWLVGGGPVSWEQVRALNARGAGVLSRAVVTDPPPMPPQVQVYAQQASASYVAVAVLVGVMALIEVVLLAGPAFAVGARRHSRNLALMASAGGTPRQARRVVLATAVVLGGVASLGGVVAGVGVGRLLVPVVQRMSSSWFGPFEVPWLHLVGVVGFGVLSALLAAAVPAYVASRQDVVAVLAGRRGDRKASLRSPVVGVLLLGAGVASAVYGATAPDGTRGSYLIAASALLAVLGMILLVPVVVVAVSRLAARLPLVLRFAARDAARHRSRTVPAVAAVAATVAGVVTLGVAVTSDEAQNRARYRPSWATGTGVLGHEPEAEQVVDWSTLRAAAERTVPGTTVTELRGPEVADGQWLSVELTVPGTHGSMLDSYGSALGSDVLVSDGSLPPGLTGLSSSDRERAEQALAAGRSVVFTNTDEHPDRVLVRVDEYDDDGGRPEHRGRFTMPVVVVPLEFSQAGPQAVLAEADARRLGVPLTTVALVLSGADISEQQEQQLDETVAGLDEGASFSVERGYQTDEETLIIQLVLLALGAVLMLGGTLTATSLALSDARPDLATLAAVGAAPRTRRGVAAAYALVVGLVGAVLGAVIGFVPGIAITYPLTSGDWMPADAEARHFLDVPWLMIGGLVVALPLLTALVVGLTTRSRLPLVARLD